MTDSKEIESSDYEESEELNYQGEYSPKFMCVKKEIPEEEICESEISTCSEAKTTSGNILHRMIKDPKNKRIPCLGKWPTYGFKSQSDLENNVHQLKAAGQLTHLNQMCSLRVTSEPNLYRQPAIIGTIGPSSSDLYSILELMEGGMNVARVNMAHVDPCNTNEVFRVIIEANNQFKMMRDYEIPVATMMDLKGPEIRTGTIDPAFISKSKTNNIFLREGNLVRLTTDKVFERRCTDKIIYVNYPGLINQAAKGNLIYISDGLIKLRVDFKEETNIACVIEIGGILFNNQRVHLPMFPTLLPDISDFDIECLDLAAKMEVDVVVVPNTRTCATIVEVKQLLAKKENGGEILVFAKISSYEGLENIDSILLVADGIVIQKNDLSLEISPAKIFIAQKQIIGKCNKMAKPVLVTAQLSSMKSFNNISRRIEMNDVASGIIDGADGIILTRETALGEEGQLTVSQISKVIREAEAASMQKPFYYDLVNELIPSLEPNVAIALAAVQISNKIQAAAILAVTTSGKTAHLLSWFRPRSPVIAITRVGKIARQMNFWRAVLPLHYTMPVLPDWFQDIKGRFEYGISYGRNQGIIQSGDLLVLVSGFRKRAGFTNCIRVVFASLEEPQFLDNVSAYYESKDSSTVNN